MSKSGSTIVLIIASLAAMASAVATGAEVASGSPFGVVCPWPGIQRAGIKWCRVGAGATAFVNWPEIEKSPNTST